MALGVQPKPPSAPAFPDQLRRFCPHAQGGGRVGWGGTCPGGHSGHSEVWHRRRDKRGQAPRARSSELGWRGGEEAAPGLLVPPPGQTWGLAFPWPCPFSLPLVGRGGTADGWGGGERGRCLVPLVDRGLLCLTSLAGCLSLSPTTPTKILAPGTASRARGVGASSCLWLLTHWASVSLSVRLAGSLSPSCVSLPPPPRLHHAGGGAPASLSL